MRLPKNSTATLFVNCNQLLDGANELDFKSYVFGQFVTGRAITPADETKTRTRA